MRTLLRHGVPIILMPFMVVVGLPLWLLTRFAEVGDNRSFIGSLLQSTGAVVFMTGFILFAWCVILFARIGKGTLAPWDPTRTLVASGPYGHVRNPMISGVAMMLLGEALFWNSRALGSWACIFVVINHLYFILSEERGLEKRFGESYRAYKKNVPRWIPRLRSWTG